MAIRHVSFVRWYSKLNLLLPDEGAAEEDAIMHQARRNEPFRYEFEQPLIGRFQIVEVDGVPVESGDGEIHVIDISPSGLKIASQLDIPIEDRRIKLSFSIMILSSVLTFMGSLVWQAASSAGYLYGVELDETKETKALIVEELKKYARERVQGEGQLG